MKQARTVLSTYSADAFGVCSALYELGGMVVMHDASGCNSTYSTHDEPRWYHSESLVFISGLTEMDAILGNDEKLKNDMLSAINDLHPAFSAIVGTPIPMMTGFDYCAAAAETEEASGIPCFGFNTSGMRSYQSGASDALAAIAERMTLSEVKKKNRSVNILGATPLDFSLSGTVQSVRKLLSGSGWNVIGCWAMGSTLDELSHAGEAQVNLVISGTGMKPAKLLKNKFGTPYVVGTPVGKSFGEHILKCLEAAAEDGIDRIAFSDRIPEKKSDFFIIGNNVVSRSLAAAISMEYGIVPGTIDPLDVLPEHSGILSANDINAEDEETIQQVCKNASAVIADPLYKAVMPEKCRFIPLPHEAFSGRMYRKDIPDLLNPGFLKNIMSDTTAY